MDIANESVTAFTEIEDRVLSEVAQKLVSKSVFPKREVQSQGQCLETVPVKYPLWVAISTVVIPQILPKHCTPLILTALNMHRERCIFHGQDKGRSCSGTRADLWYQAANRQIELSI